MSADLKKFGINPGESKRLKRLSPEERQQELTQNLEAYTNEVLADNPVSILYHYWPSENGKFYTRHSLKPIYDADSQFDMGERLGLPQQGFQYLKKLLMVNPEKVILWYSPPGPAAFDQDPADPYSEITYDYGQLYIQYYDGEKINALALKISDESVIKQFSPQLGKKIEGQYINPRQKITDLLLSPVATPLTIDEFIGQPYQDQFVYRDNKGGGHSLFNILESVRATFAGEKPQTLDINVKPLEFDPTEQKVKEMYLQAIYHYCQSTGGATINLSGSCGGTVAEISEIEKLLGIRTRAGQNPVTDLIGLYSSLDRLIKNESDSIFECPNCHTKINTKTHGPIGNQCPHCKITKEHWAEKNVTC